MSWKANEGMGDETEPLQRRWLWCFSYVVCASSRADSCRPGRSLRACLRGSV